MPHLILSDASLAYGHVPLLDHADFQLDPGECVALIGRNGTGKSSLLRALAGQGAIDDGSVPARTLMLPLNTNARAKMSLLRHGFVKIFCRPATGVVIGGVVVAPIASELILPIALAVQNRISVTDLAQTLSVYPSLSGSIVEAARRLMAHDDLD